MQGEGEFCVLLDGLSNSLVVGSPPLRFIDGRLLRVAGLQF